MTSSFRLAAVLPLLLVATACGEIPGLVAFGNEFRSHFQLNAVDVKRSDAELAITVGDERFRSMTDAERGAVARRMAEYVRDHYEGYSRVDAVTLRFAHTRRVAIATTTTSTHVHRFPREELGPPGGAGQRNAEPAGAY
jgi:hypothetical protein